jgi:hypothetical protein
MYCEVENIIKKLKTDKTPGPDRIENNTLKQLSEALIKPLTTVFNTIVKTGISPAEWNVSEMIILHKKGSRDRIENYRPLSLSDNLNKMFMKILRNRMYCHLDNNQSQSQAGFRKGYSTIDHIHTINQVLEKSNEYNLEIHFLFVDFHKAFDTIDHCRLWEAMHKQGCQTEVIRILQNLYQNAEAYIKIESAGPRFKVKRGVKQGDPLSPNLFTCALESIFRELDWEEYGMSINGMRLHNLRFADDLILISGNKDELERMGEELFAKCDEWGLQANKIKTKYMSNNIDTQLTIEGTIIEKVEEYTYLGQVISISKGIESELAVRKEKAWRSYWSLKGIFKGNMSIRSKIRVLEMCVMPVLCYGAQTWALTKSQVEGLRVTQRTMERSILKIKKRDKIRNRDIRGQTQSTDVGYKIKKAKFQYAGHIMRSERERWTKILTEWRPYEGKRNKGRPKTRWRDELERRVGKFWHRETQDRKKWKLIGEAYARQWDGWLRSILVTNNRL